MASKSLINIVFDFFLFQIELDNLIIQHYCTSSFDAVYRLNQNSHNWLVVNANKELFDLTILKFKTWSMVMIHNL